MEVETESVDSISSNESIGGYEADDELEEEDAGSVDPEYLATFNRILRVRRVAKEVKRMLGIEGDSVSGSSYSLSSAKPSRRTYVIGQIWDSDSVFDSDGSWSVLSSPMLETTSAGKSWRRHPITRWLVNTGIQVTCELVTSFISFHFNG